MQESIGREIAKARKLADMTQHELSKATGLSRSYICDIENDRYMPSIKSLVSIASAIKIDLNFLTQMTEIQDIT